MKILHVTDCYLPRLGGIEMQVHDLAQRQAASGHEVEVVTATPDAERPGAKPQVNGVPVHRVTARLPYQLPLHPRGAHAVQDILERGHHDVVHVHAGVVSPFAFAAVPVTLRARVPTVITVHSMWAYTTPLFRALDGAVRWSAWPLALSAVSDAAAEPIRAVAGRRTAVDVLPNGVDPEEWRIDPVERDPSDVHIVAVMRLAPRKRALTLLRMLRRVAAAVPSEVRLQAVIIGEGPERPSLERYLRRHDMTGWVDLPGRRTRDEIREVFRRADMFVAPASLESFGIAALEARCAGLPVVARAGTGVREFIVDGREGLLAERDADMAAAILRLATTPSLREQISAHNRSAPPTVTWDDVLKRAEETYERAVATMEAAEG